MKEKKRKVYMSDVNQEIDFIISCIELACVANGHNKLYKEDIVEQFERIRYNLDMKSR